MPRIYWIIIDTNRILYVLWLSKFSLIINKENFPVSFIQTIYNCLSENQFYSVVDNSLAFFTIFNLTSSKNVYTANNIFHPDETYSIH